jgi:sugar (pentulose or hexulose) kinase
VLAELRDAAGPPPAIGLSGQMHGLVTLDADDRPVRPAILSNDQRTAAQVVEIEERIGLDRLIALTGNRALTGFTAPKLLWIAEHEPNAHARVASIMLPKDYVRLRLCGEHATDVADASGTLLFDVGARRWCGRGLRRARGAAGVAAARARVARGLRHDARRRPDRGGRRRPGRGRPRRRREPRRPRLRRPRHVWRPSCSPR